MPMTPEAYIALVTGLAALIVFGAMGGLVWFERRSTRPTPKSRLLHRTVAVVLNDLTDEQKEAVELFAYSQSRPWRELLDMVEHKQDRYPNLRGRLGGGQDAEAAFHIRPSLEQGAE